MNTTLTAASMISCNMALQSNNILSNENPLLQQTRIGCTILLILQEMLHFRINYMNIPSLGSSSMELERQIIGNKFNQTPDLYIRPMGLDEDLLDVVEPLEAIYEWRCGFMLRRVDFGIFRSFYTEPFSERVWTVLWLLVVLVSIVFYFMRNLEGKMYKTNEDPSFIYQCIITLGACCQHYLPVYPRLMSRRTAYATFSIFAHLIYSFYTSNLLSHLVSDRTNNLSLKRFAESEYKCVVLNSMRNIVENPVVAKYAKGIIDSKFKTVKTVNIKTGLEAIQSGNTAVLCDYVTFYGYIRKHFSNDVICQLVEVDLHRNVQKYMFASKTSPFKKSLKIGLLRLSETGIMSRLIKSNIPTKPICVTKPQVSAEFKHIMIPLTILGVAILASIFILVLERISYANQLVLPYID